MKLLIKFPTKNRPLKFLSVLKNYIDYTSNITTNYYTIYDNIEKYILNLINSINECY
jgi:hypothetical protein